MARCDHPDFAAFVDVARLTKVDDGPVTGFSASIRVQCSACGESFQWLGAPVGMSPRQPMASVDGLELRVPLRPASAPAGWGEDGPGFHVGIGLREYGSIEELRAETESGR